MFLRICALTHAVFAYQLKHAANACRYSNTHDIIYWDVRNKYTTQKYKLYCMLQ